MEGNFTKEFKEIFCASVRGEDIREARFNAWTALDTARGILPREDWKLTQMQHAIQVQENEETGEAEAFVMCEAIWVYNPGSDNDGGKHAMLSGPDSLDPDGIENETEKEVQETRPS